MTLKPSTLKKWAYSMHICSRLVQDFGYMAEGNTETEVIFHKEEKPARIRSDADDRKKIRLKLENCINPLDPTDHPDDIINIVTGRKGPKTVNAPRAVEIGKAQMQSFERSWPEVFNAPLSKEVVTMAVTRKAIRVGPESVCDVNLFYTCVLGLQQSHGIKLSEVLQYELSPVPTLMFDEKGNMQIAKTKSVLKRNLKVEIFARLAPKPEVTIIDGCAILWIIYWPNNGTIQYFVDNFTSFIDKRAEISKVYLVLVLV